LPPLIGGNTNAAGDHDRLRTQPTFSGPDALTVFALNFERQALMAEL